MIRKLHHGAYRCRDSEEARRFRGGDIRPVEDVSGRGHRTRTVNNRSRRSVFVTLD